MLVFPVELLTPCVPCSKCQQYSPTESNKAFDKAVNRRSGVTFDPRSVLEELKRRPKAPPRAKEDYLKQYVEARPVWHVTCGMCACVHVCIHTHCVECVPLCVQFKHLMNRLDPFEEGEDSDGDAHPHHSHSTTPAPPSSLPTTQQPKAWHCGMSQLLSTLAGKPTTSISALYIVICVCVEMT